MLRAVTTLWPLSVMLLLCASIVQGSTQFSDDSSLSPTASGTTLFDDDTPLSITVTAPFRNLIFLRMDKEEYPAALQYNDMSGNRRALSIAIAARGNSRLDVCDFPPLRLIIDKQRAAGTLFAGQHRIKMVTQCLTKRKAADWLLLEYGIYRAYNIVSDYSLRVRRLEVTLLDSEHEGWERQQSAFLIEPFDQAATRLGRDVLRPPNVQYDQFNKTELARNSLFQYLIGNTDFAVKRGPKGEGCCHNGRVVAPAGRQRDWVVLPYDFDLAGLLNTDYALPATAFRIRSVRTRVYRGFCLHNDELLDSIELFNDNRDEILAALIAEGLSNRKAKQSERYVNRFYSTINDMKDLQKRLLDVCRGPDSVSVRATRTKE